MRFILPYIKQHKRQYIPAILFLLVSTGLDMLNPLLTRSIIDNVIGQGHTELLFSILLALLLVSVGRAISGYEREYLFDKAASGLAAGLRRDIFRHLNTLSVSFFDSRNTGELMSRIKEDVDNVMSSTGFCVMLLIQQSFYIVIPAAVLFTLNWKLTLLYLLFMPLVMFLAFVLEKKLGAIFEKISDQAAVLNTTAQENISGVRLVRSMAREGHEEEKFDKENDHNYRLNREQARIWADLNPVITFLAGLMTVAVITVGGIFVIGGGMSVGTLVAVNGYGLMLSWPMQELGWLINLMAQARASIKKIKGLMDQTPEVVPPEDPEVPEHAAGAVSFKNVGFRRGETRILENISVDIPAGRTLAVMGYTGSGKTSLISLLCRYYDCTEGAVEIDGLDVRRWDLAALRSRIAVVMQDVFLFSDTVYENILFGHDTDIANAEELPLEGMEHSAADAQIAPFIDALPERYDTIIGERGIGLSGGQKQRLSIARALLKDCRILVLDDATSSLDMETEYEIQRAVEKRREVTKIIIAHRISAVKDADEILVLDKGAVVERGSHQSLMAAKGYYYETFVEQYGEIPRGGGSYGD